MKNVFGLIKRLRQWRRLSMVMLSGGLACTLSSCLPKSGSEVESSFLGGIAISSLKSQLTLSSNSIQPSDTATVRLVLLDQNDNAYISPTPLTITFALTGGTTNGTFSAITDNGDGTYSTTFTATHSGTASKVVASVNGKTLSDQPSITVLPGTLSLSNSTVIVSSSTIASTSSLTVTLTTIDTHNNALGVGGSTVSFATSGGASTGTFSAVTDHGDGTYSATFTGVVSGSATTITAQIDGQAVTNTLPTVTVTPGATTQLALSGISSPLTAGSAQSLTVTAQDINGNTTPSYTGTVAFSTSSTLKTLPANYTFTSGVGQDNGVHTFAGLQLKTSGTQSLTVADTLNGSIAGYLLLLTVNPAATSVLSVSGFTSPATSATSYSFTVTAQDTYGNTTPGYTGTVAFTSSAATKSLPANYTFIAGDNGTHNFSGSITTAGSQSITATDTVTGSITGSQSSITVYPVVSFSAATQDVAINQGTATVTVSLNTPAGAGQTVTVPLTTNASSTAVTTTDYTLSGSSLSFAPGQSSKNITVTLVDQLSPATSNATITLDLGTLTNGVAGATTSQTLTIRQPSLDLNFTAMYDPATQMAQAPYNAISFSRASTATYTDCDGIIKSAAANVPRVDCDPITGQPKGLLVEETRTNLYPQSAGFGTATWTKGAGAGSISIGANALAPDGTTTAVKLVEGAGTDTNIFITRDVTITTSTSYCGSYYVKPAERTVVRIATANQFAPAVWVAFNLSSGTVYGTSGTAPASYGIASAANGWYRIYMCNTNTTGTWGSLMLQMVSNTNQNSYTGDGTSGLYAWGAQFEQGTFPTSYIPTTTAAVTRAADAATVSNASSWLGSQQGTYYADARLNTITTSGGYQTIAEINDGSPNNRLSLMLQESTPSLNSSSTVGGAWQGASALGALAINTRYKIASAYAPGVLASSINQGTVVSATGSPTMPTVSTLYLGYHYGTPYPLNGTLGRFSYFKQPLANSVQTLSNTSGYYRTYTPTINLTATSQTVIEPQGTVYVTAALSEPATATLTVPYTVGGTAVSGTNYSGLASGNLTFAAGESRKTLSFSLLDDGGSTSPTITIALSSGTGFALGTNTTQTITIQRPSLDLNFNAMYNPATQASLAPYNAVTYARTSSASFVDATGLVAYAASNVPRIDYNPTTHQPNGLLIEESRTNLALRSSDLSNASWTKSNTTVVANATIAPDGSTTAQQLVESTTAAVTHSAKQTPIAITANTTYTFSVFVKAAGRSVVQIAMDNLPGGANWLNGQFNLSTMATTTGAGGAASGVTARITAYPNNWYRISLTGLLDATSTSADFYVMPCSAYPGGQNYTGDGSSGLYVWGAQLEAGAFPTAYIPTTTASVTRAADNFSTTNLSWFNTSTGSLLTQGATEYATATATQFPMWLSFYLDLNNRIELYNNAGSNIPRVVQATSGTSTFIANGTFSQGSPINMSFAYNANDYVGTNNGSLQNTSNTMTVPTGLSAFYLGSRATAYYLNGTENRLTYYPARLSNVQLQLLSSSSTYTPRTTTPSVTLTASSQSVLQSGGQAFFVAALSEPARATITVPYTISGTAVSATDYSGLSSGTMTFTAGQSRAVLNFTVNATANTGRTVILTLGSPTGATLGTYTSETIYLVNTTTGLALTSSTVINNGSIVTFSGTCGPGMTITISGTQSATTTCTAGGTWTWTSSTISTDGSYSFNFSQSDGINTGSTISGTYNRDATAPSTVASLTDGNYTTNATQSPTMTWPATTDPTVNSYNSGVSYYLLAIGTSAGASDVVTWTNVGNVTTYQFTGLSLTNGTMYYGSIKAVDTAGNISAVRQGDGFAVITDTPTLSLNFSSGSSPMTNTNSSYPAMVQFSRASGANVSAGTYYNASGTIATAPANYLKYSQDFSQSPWLLTDVNLGTGYTAPDGTSTALKIIENNDSGVNNYHYAVAYNVPLPTAGIAYTCSFYTKAGERWKHGIRFQTPNGVNGVSGTIDLNAGTATGLGTNGAATSGSIGISSVGNGWYRVWASAILDGSTTNATCYPLIFNAAGNSNNYPGDGSGGHYMWGMQIEAGTSPTQLIYTNGAVAYGPRFDYNPSSCSGTCAARGLLIEESRSNKLLQSSNFATSWTAVNFPTVNTTATTAPDGTTTANLIVESSDGAATSHYLTQNSAQATNAGYTFSTYVKSYSNDRWVALILYDQNATGNFLVAYYQNSGGVFSYNSSAVFGTATYHSSVVTALPNGWYRISVTGQPSTNANTGIIARILTTTSAATTMTGNGTSGLYLWGAQLEAGYYQTTYIPTTTAFMTRNADVAKVLNMTPLSGAQGTLYASGTSGPSFNTTTTNQGFVIASLESATNRIQMRRIAGNATQDGRLSVYMNGGGAGLANTAIASWPLLTTKTIAEAYSSTDASAAWEGVLIPGAPGGGMTAMTPTQLYVGYSALFGTYFNGWVQSLQFYSNRLTDSALKGLTAP